MQPINQHDLYVLPLVGGTDRFEVLPSADERVTDFDASESDELWVTFESPRHIRELVLRCNASGKWRIRKDNIWPKLKSEAERGKTTHDLGNPRHKQFHFGYGIEAIEIEFDAYNRIWNRNGKSSDLAAWNS